MKLLTIEEIMKFQKEFGIDDLQEMVLTKDFSKIHGIHGVQIITHLQMGSIFLPEETSISDRGDIIPSRTYFDNFGTLSMSQAFWSVVIKRENKKSFKEAFMYDLETRKFLSVTEN